VTCVLLAAQGVVGAVQYNLELPAEIVWIHVALAALLWLAMLWATAAIGSVESRRRAAVGAERVTAEPPLVPSS
jgi:cytochrome c oxidase assembly protein subunit 15